VKVFGTIKNEEQFVGGFAAVASVEKMLQWNGALSRAYDINTLALCAATDKKQFQENSW